MLSAIAQDASSLRHYDGRMLTALAELVRM